MTTTSERAKLVTRRLIDRGLDAVIFVRRDMSIVYANQAALTMFGYSREELIGNNVDMLVPEDKVKRHYAGSDKFWANPKITKLSVDAGLTIKRKDGTFILIEAELEPFNVGTTNPLVAMIIRQYIHITPLVGWPLVIKQLKLWHVGVAASILGVLWGVLAVVAKEKTTFWVVNAGIISIGVGLIVAYSNAVIDAFRKYRTGLTAGHLLAMGICVNWLGIVVRQAAFYFTGDYPQDVPNSYLDLLQIWIIALSLSFSGGVLQIAAVESVDSTWAPRYFLVSAGVAAMITLVALVWGWMT